MIASAEEFKAFVTTPQCSLEDLEQALLNAVIALGDHAALGQAEKTRFARICARAYDQLQGIRKDIAANKGA